MYLVMLSITINTCDQCYLLHALQQIKSLTAPALGSSPLPCSQRYRLLRLANLNTAPCCHGIGNRVTKPNIVSSKTTTPASPLAGVPDSHNTEV